MSAHDPKRQKLNFSGGLGWILFGLTLLASLAEMGGWILPTISWPFNVSFKVDLLHAAGGFLWFGWLIMGVSFSVSLSLIFGKGKLLKFSPLARLRWQRFKSIRRGYWSMLILIALAILAGLDKSIVGKRALAVRYDGNWSFPAFERSPREGKDYGLVGNLAESEPNYRELQSVFAQERLSNFVVMPLIPFDSGGDTLDPAVEKLNRDSDGKLFQRGEPFSGYAFYLEKNDISQPRIRARFSNGKLIGGIELWNESRELRFSGEFPQSEKNEKWEQLSGNEKKLIQQFATGKNESFEPMAIHYHPAPPLIDGHLLGTNSQGLDLLAYVYGGLQVNFQAALIYIPVVTFIGSFLGLMMGWLGGWFDLVSQRGMEILSQIPLLSLIIIVSDSVPIEYKGLGLILLILLIFDWMGVAYLMRTSAFREKARDYVAAARVLGAGTGRILFVHLLPNTLSILITLVPFSVSGLVLSLASLDYLGFGLPPEYASWGRLLNDGLASLSSPWIVSSGFVCLVGILLLVTFVGEAVREAFDPKKFTYYR